MSRYFSSKFEKLTPYVPGEQPKDMKYIKLNTNESPFPPSEKAVKAAAEEALNLRLYPDPELSSLAKAFAAGFGVGERNVIFTNGSDDLLNFAFMAFCDRDTGAAFPDISYGFYPVFAEFNNIDYKEIPLKDDFSIDTGDYKGLGRTIFIANPNTPTGLTLAPGEIEEILAANPDNVVVIDEAYVDFGAESCVTLIEKYDNLLVIGTFSKSRSMAGARLGYGIGSEELINDLNTVRFSTNPYNINRMTMAAGIGALSDPAYTENNCLTIIKNREYTACALKELGFTMTDSKANFLFAKHPGIPGEELYLKLKKRGVLVRHFAKDRIGDHVRITIGTLDDMKSLIAAVKAILEEK